jgi:hypothetical protein
MTVKEFIEHINTACTLNGLDMDELEMTIMIDGNRVANIRDLEFFNEELALYVD